MFQVGEYLVYKKDVCLVKEIKKNYRNNLDYFILTPEADESLKIEIPTNSHAIRKLITKKELEELIQKIPEIKTIEVEDKKLEGEYKLLLNKGNHEGLIQIIKTTYLRNQKRLGQKKKVGEKDNFYLEEAEQNLYRECSRVLGLSLEQTKKYIEEKVKSLLGNRII